MTKEITKAYIIQELGDRFKLREFEPEPFTLSEQVVPIYDVENHLQKIERLTKTVSITSSGAVYIFGVPENERWYLQRYNVIFMTGVYTIAGAFVGRHSFTEYTYLDLALAVAASYTNDLSKAVRMDASDTFNVNIDGYTSTGDLLIIAEVIKEEIR